MGPPEEAVIPPLDELDEALDELDDPLEARGRRRPDSSLEGVDPIADGARDEIVVAGPGHLPSRRAVERPER